MQRGFHHGLLALALWLVASIGAVAQPAGTVEGIIVDTSDTRLGGVTVALGTDADSPTTSTDADGTFQFVGVPPGLYTLVASLAGFEEV
ncbi:MAG: carboxypeptidase-like regulatory domain-containing protein, partial [Vicinamibacterales bacterium]|nr:carboxypeptidase-like regulatory domain-containing protein [Vicinamibacterales bacterium]